MAANLKLNYISPTFNINFSNVKRKLSLNSWGISTSIDFLNGPLEYFDKIISFEK
jgi:hypothetical protein